MSNIQSNQSKENLLILISLEKEEFLKYSQSCSNYQIEINPIALARHQGRMEILETLLRQKGIKV